MKHRHYKIVADRLYRYDADQSLEDLIEDQDTWKLFAPKENREQILRECHDEPVDGYLDHHKTYERVALYYYLPALYKDVTQYVKDCTICQQIKAQQLAPAELMGRHTVAQP